MPIFGSAQGTSAALGDMMQGAQLQGQQLHNQSMAMQLAEQARMSQLAQQEAAQGAGKSPADQLEAMANLALKSGFTASGSKMATDAAGIRLKQAQTIAAGSKSFQAQATAAKTELNMADSLLSGVNDQASWDAANSLYESMTGRQSPFKGVPYNPAMIAQLQQATLTMKDRLHLKIEEMNAQTRAASAEGAQSFRNFREGYLAQDLALRRERETRLSKPGGKNADIGAPVKSEVDHADALLKEAFPDLPDSERTNASYTVAARAKAIRKTTPGMDADTAMQRAITESRGQFKTLNDSYKILGMDVPGTGHEVTHFTHPGMPTAPQPGKSAMALPPNPTAQTLKGGQAYKLPGGQVGTWNPSTQSFDLEGE
jgi:hypothetical protein